MLYFTREGFHCLANQSWGHIRVMLEHNVLWPQPCSKLELLIVVHVI